MIAPTLSVEKLSQAAFPEDQKTTILRQKSAAIEKREQEMIEQAAVKKKLLGVANSMSDLSFTDQLEYAQN